MCQAGMLKQQLILLLYGGYGPLAAMEYASAVWDPHLDVYINMLEKIQRRAAKWIIGCYDRYSSVTAMLNGLI